MNKFINDARESHRLYQDLVKNHPHFFEDDNGVKYVTDPELIEKFEKETGERIGVLYQKGDHERFVLDLVEEDGQLKSSGRLILPEKGVIIVPKIGDKFVLEDQYRSQNCRSFLAFPRGHREPKCTLIKDAEREIKEELSGAHLENARRIGKTYPETHSCAWYCDIVSGDIEGLEFGISNKINMNGYEGINKLVLLSAEEIDALINNGEIDCGYTLAAWAIYKSQA